MPPLSCPAADNVRAYVAAHYGDLHLTAGTILGALRLRGSRALVRRGLGQPLIDYLRDYRIGMARRLLRESELSVAQVAYDVGYGSPEAFTRAFERLVGQTPTAYRRGCRMIKQNNQAA